MMQSVQIIGNGHGLIITEQRHSVKMILAGVTKQNFYFIFLFYFFKQALILLISLQL